MKNRLRTQYHLLNALGVPIWRTRQSKTVFPLSSEPCILCAHCLVLLPEDPKRMDEEAQKIFQGMLSVLNLPLKNIHIAFLNDKVDQTQNALLGAITALAPYTLLIMGQKLAKIVFPNEEIQDLNKTLQVMTNLKAVLQITHHPEELQAQPFYKKEAYRDLLQLKNHLNTVGAI